MNTKGKLQQLTDEELRQQFRQHSIRGMIVSLLLLVGFLLLYFFADSENTVIFVVTIVIATASILLAIWYHARKRQIFNELKRRSNKV
ncbi:hypothetical protein [Tunicatimonas pelagia]|uniref:hypothetical protein n=1 Tax=Tunicatimonas pelagia TaxID=931531 RepID=UPI002666557B|nr:hypothetical protein [Tunicatimonas pelagia]WKN40949.1 hypothetical protein P0M28_18105 [Tunicatimonas pelagia]